MRDTTTKTRAKNADLPDPSPDALMASFVASDARRVSGMGRW
jgi:hypothetical protein